MRALWRVILVGALAGTLVSCGDDEVDPADPAANPSPSPAVATVDPSATFTGGPPPTPEGTPEGTCEPEETFTELPATHIKEGEAVEYNSDPPTSGPHLGTPANPGLYTEALPDEQVVHNLEHGQIVIWYSAGAPLDVMDQLGEVLDEAPDATIIVPRAFDDPSTIVLTAWTALQRCTGIAPEVITQFRVQYQGKGPEKVVPPFEPTAP